MTMQPRRTKRRQANATRLCVNLLKRLEKGVLLDRNTGKRIEAPKGLAAPKGGKG